MIPAPRNLGPQDNHGKQCADAVDVISAVKPQPFNPTAIARPCGRPVNRFPEQLRLHRALDELGWADEIDDFNHAARLKDLSAPEPVLITTNGTILAGHKAWRVALFEDRLEIQCIEYSLDDDEALRFILNHHNSRCGWNKFVRVRVALKLEPYFQHRALENMRNGGRYKGSANLPEAERIDVRQQIADAAGVGARTVTNVKTILSLAHSRLIDALQNDGLAINCAIQFCRLPRAEQLKQFICFMEERATNKVIRQSIGRLKKQEVSPDVIAVLKALLYQEARQPGSVVVRVGRHQHSIVLRGRDFSSAPHPQQELELT